MEKQFLMTFKSRHLSNTRFLPAVSSTQQSETKLLFKYSTLALALLLGVQIQSAQAQEVKGDIYVSKPQVAVETPKVIAQPTTPPVLQNIQLTPATKLSIAGENAAQTKAAVSAFAQEMPIVAERPTNDADLWARIRRGYMVNDLSSGLVANHEQWYASRPSYIGRMTERSSKYLYHVVEELERRNMPTELALLPFIESAFNPQAVSGAKAAGMWQFMPATGKYFA
jgi:hypothetical protein